MRIGTAEMQPGQTGHQAAWQLLERLYRQQTGEPLPEVARTERGKPYFVDSPWHFSITHTKRHVFCALSERSVGIDAEELDREIRLELAGKILSGGERAQYEQAADRRQALLKFWVLKEADAKCSGEGLRGYPRKDTAFSLDDPRVRVMDGCLVAVIEEDDYVI